MNAKTPMNGGAIDAEEDPKRNRSPSRVLRITIETDLVVGFGLELPENCVFVGEGIRRHWRKRNGIETIEIEYLGKKI